MIQQHQFYTVWVRSLTLYQLKNMLKQARHFFFRSCFSLLDYDVVYVAFIYSSLASCYLLIYLTWHRQLDEYLSFTALQKHYFHISCALINKNGMRIAYNLDTMNQWNNILKKCKRKMCTLEFPLNTTPKLRYDFYSYFSAIDTSMQMIL